MIWDEVRAQTPAMRDPEIQVIRVPFEIARPGADPSAASLVTFARMIPRRDEHIDGTWIRPPYRKFVIASALHDESCIFVEAYSPKAEQGNFPGAYQAWAFTAALWVKNGSGLGVAAYSVATTDSEGRVITTQTVKSPARQEELKMEAGKRGIRTLHLAPKEEMYDAITVATINYVVVAMALMSCKNVKTVEAQPSRQLRRQAERKGLPLVSWHELVIPAERTSSGGCSAGTSQGESVALHWVRGHFKDLRENGLFGKHKGVYWWGPHLAGQADRVVFKDYVLEESTT